MPKRLDAPALLTLQAIIDYRFSDSAVLRLALTHRSAAEVHMERLEFLGDAVLGAVIAAYLYQRFPDQNEGALSRMRAHLVRREGLLAVAHDWNIDACLRVGEGERKGNTIRAASILANAVEAVIGAVHQDGGWQAAEHVVLRAWQPLLDALRPDQVQDAKTRLQELTQGKGWGVPEYQVEDLGAEHVPRFKAQCLVCGKVMGTGYGSRKKSAEFEASQHAWEALQA